MTQGSAPPAQPWFAVGDDRMRLLVTGAERMAALIALIEGARRSLRILFYIYADDRAGRQVRDALEAAQSRGVAVSVVIDGFGSEVARDDGFFAGLEAAGGRVCRFQPRFGRRYLLRNHQKLALADAETGDARVITGGFNVEDGYFGLDGDDNWRDLGLEMTGPSAGRIADYHDAIADWACADKAKMRALRQTLARYSEREGSVRWLLGGPTARLSPWARSLRHDLRHARQIEMVAAYFAPGPILLRRIDRAGEGGRLRLVTAAKSDNRVTIDAARFTYRNLLRHGARIYEYQPAKLHTKLYVTDDVVNIGSANFDMRSLFVNLEIMLRVDDAAFAAHVRAYVEGEIARSQEITRDLHRSRSTLWTRIRQFGCYLLIAVVDVNVSRRLAFGPEGR